MILLEWNVFLPLQPASEEDGDLVDNKANGIEKGEIKESSQLLTTYDKLKKNFKKVFGKRKSFLPLQPATEVTRKWKERGI